MRTKKVCKKKGNRRTNKTELVEKNKKGEERRDLKMRERHKEAKKGAKRKRKGENLQVEEKRRGGVIKSGNKRNWAEGWRLEKKKKKNREWREKKTLVKCEWNEKGGKENWDDGGKKLENKQTPVWKNVHMWTMKNQIHINKLKNKIDHLWL